jgi:hypothetical protein
MSTIADAALALVHAYHWEIFPLRPGSRASFTSKEDNGRRWGASRDPGVIRDYWERWSNANIGLPTGSANDLLVLDIDTPEGHDKDGFASLKDLEERHEPLPRTLQATTPNGGLHYYFGKPPHIPIRSTASELAPGIDIRCNGGMVVCPPSTRKGKAYAWVDPTVPIAPAPAWLIEAVRDPTPTRPEPPKHDWPLPEQAEIAAAVEAISNDDATDWEHWNKIGLAIYAVTSGSDFGFDLFVGWSAKNARKFDSEKTTKKWAAFGRSPPDRITVGSLFWHADLGDPDWRHLYQARKALAGLRGSSEPPPPQNKPPGPPEPPEATGFGHVEIGDFWAALEDHRYLYAPTSALWPSRSVDSLFGKLPALDAQGKPRLNKDGDKILLAASVWLDRHRPIHQVFWAPSQGHIVRDLHLVEGGWVAKPGVRCFNLYRPPSPPAPGPRANSPEPWLAHLRTLYPADWPHLLAWFAHHVQHPGVKVNHSVVLLGQPGTGKDMLLQPLVQAVGPWNWRDVSPQDVLSSYNGYTQAVILRINEARDLGDTTTRYQFYERTKTLMASPPDAIMVNEKYIKHRTVLNCCGVIVTTNNIDSLYLPEGDRRHYVANSTVQRADYPDGYFNDLQDYYDQGGYAAVRGFLMSYDLSAFNAKAAPPETQAFWEIVENSKPAEIEEVQAALMILGHPPALTVKQLVDVCGDKPSLVSFADWLSDRKNNRRISSVLDGVGYLRVRNPAVADGRWPLASGKALIYGRKDLPDKEREQAARDLAGDNVVLAFRRPAPAGR